MNKEEEEAPLEDPCVRRNHRPPFEDPPVHRNCLARERHVARSKEQRTTNANRRAAQLFKTKCFLKINTIYRNQGLHNVQRSRVLTSIYI
jgi:hypothetical protein